MPGRPAAARDGAAARRARRASRCPSCRRTCRRRAPRSTTLVSPVHDLHACRACRVRDRLHLAAQQVPVEPLLEYQRQAERDGPGAGDREVVHGPVHRELADRAPGEAERLHHEAVGGHRHLRLAAERHRCRARRARRRRMPGRTVPRSGSGVALPPAPCDIVIRWSRNFGRFARAVSMMPRMRSSRPVAAPVSSHDLALPSKAPEVVVGGAGSLRRDHAGPDRALRRAGGPEDLALPGLDHALQHLAALAGLGSATRTPGPPSAARRRSPRRRPRACSAALRDEAEPAPLEVRRAARTPPPSPRARARLPS